MPYKIRQFVSDVQTDSPPIFLPQKREHTTARSNSRRIRSSLISSSSLFLCSMKDSMSGHENSVVLSNSAPSLPIEASKAGVSSDSHIKPQSLSLKDIQHGGHESGGECSSVKTHVCFDKEATSQGKTVDDNGKETGAWDAAVQEDYGRERLKRHRIEGAGRVWIPDIWGQEELLKDWIDCSAFDACLVPNGIVSARASLADKARRANSTGLRIENSC